MSIDRWIDKEVVVYLYNEILFSLKTERNPAICNMGELERHHAKWNKPDTESQILREITYM